MGCPDWPKCFDRWVPPTDVSQLPVNYQEIYGHRGYDSTEFNVLKTWTEYVNRLIGAITGFVMLLTAVFSWHYLKKGQGNLFRLSVLAVLLVGFQAWLGGKVVETNLKTYLVTIHMLVALLILALMVYLSFKARYPAKSYSGVKKDAFAYYWGIACLVLTIVQIAGGTQVRELVDEIAIKMNNTGRGNWIGAIGGPFEFHRDFSIIVLLANMAWVFLLNRRYGTGEPGRSIAWYIGGLTLMQIITGMVMSYRAIPPVFQTVHLVLASALFGLQFLAILRLRQYARSEAIGGVQNA